MEKNTVVYIPAELIPQILLNLPVKSLIRFKCVSKSWFSLISNSNFANSHFKLSQTTQTSRNRILSMLSTSPPRIRSIDIDALVNDDHSASFNLDGLLPQSYFSLEIKGSCRGFLFLLHDSKFSLWNPSTGFHRPIPFSPFHSNFLGYGFTCLYGFGYDRSTDDYLIVLFSYNTAIDNISSHLEFFSLRNNTWKEIKKGAHIHLGYTYPRKPGTLFNGAIHWLVNRRDSMVSVIVVFDLLERKMFEVNLPIDFWHIAAYPTLWVFEEFLSILAFSYADSTLEIWVMKDNKLRSSWTKTSVLPINDDSLFFSPLCSTKSNDIIGTTSWGYGLVKCNDKRQMSEYRSFYNNPYLSEMVVYTESLLSLPGDP